MAESPYLCLAATSDFDRLATLRVTDTLGLADDIMELGRIRHLPVVSAGVVVGIVSQL